MKNRITLKSATGFTLVELYQAIIDTLADVDGADDLIAAVLYLQEKNANRKKGEPKEKVAFIDSEYGQTILAAINKVITSTPTSGVAIAKAIETAGIVNPKTGKTFMTAKVIQALRDAGFKSELKKITRMKGNTDLKEEVYLEHFSK